MEELGDHYKKVGNLGTAYKTRGLKSPEITSFLDGIDLSKHIEPNAKVLEVGCGAGNLLTDLQDTFGVECYGIDRFPIPTEKSTTLNIITGDAGNIPLPNNFVEFAVSYFTFQYIPDKLKALSEIYRVLKIGGTGIVDFDNLDIDQNDDTRLIDRCTRPSLDTIMDIYSSNKDKISSSRVNIYSDKGWQIRRSRRLLINKKDNNPLHFPELKHFTTDKCGFPLALSYY